MSPRGAPTGTSLVLGVCCLFSGCHCCLLLLLLLLLVVLCVCVCQANPDDASQSSAVADTAAAVRQWVDTATEKDYLLLHARVEASAGRWARKRRQRQAAVSNKLYHSTMLPNTPDVSRLFAWPSTTSTYLQLRVSSFAPLFVDVLPLSHPSLNMMHAHCLCGMLCRCVLRPMPFQD